RAGAAHRDRGRARPRGATRPGGEVATMAVTALRPLRHRDFRLLFTSSAVSSLGNWFDFVAVLVLVSQIWDLGARGLATVSIALAVPYLGAPLIGVLVDRAAPRTVMVISDGARALLTLGLVVAPNLLVLAPLLALRAACTVAFGPAAQTAIKHSVRPEDLFTANGTHQTALQALKVAGPALGGLLVTVLDVRSVIALNAASFVASGLLLTGLALRSVDTGAERKPYRRELTDGLALIRRTPALRLVVVVLGCTVFMVFLYDSMSPLAVEALRLPPAYIGYLVAAVGLGGVAGALGLSQWGSGLPPFALMATAQLLVGGAVGVIGAAIAAAVTAPAVVWLAVAFALGVASAGVLVPYPYVVQTSTPSHLLGRTWTTVSMLPAALQVLAPLTAAALVPAVGLGRVFLVAAAGLAVVAALTVTLSRGITLRPPEAPADGSPQSSDHPGDRDEGR
ncbi:MAG: MFS transporter, partial [Actinomycetia bacterium]|nr:MFS transporter [Actinomycetes bacterium]